MDPLPPKRSESARSRLPRFDGADQRGNSRPHDFRLSLAIGDYPFCIDCSKVRQADGSTDRKPCAGPTGLSVWR